MRELSKRTLTGVGVVGLTIFCVLSGRYTFFVLCFVISLLALIEFYRLTEVKKRQLGILGLVLSSSLLITVALFINGHADSRILLVNFPLVSLIFITILLPDSNRSFKEVAFVFLGQIYITLPLMLLYLCAFVLDDHRFNPDLLLGYFFLLWANDTGAYVFGSLFGTNKLAISISPNKTWEGSAGGAFLVLVVAYINYYFLGNLPLAGWMVLSIIVVVMGTIGDLTKSVLKRSRNVKDSGTLLPGHGGILDRFDSLIGSVPLVYAYLFCSFNLM